MRFAAIAVVSLVCLAPSRAPGQAQKASDDLVGSIGIHAVNRVDRRCDLGYWLAANARGHGVMTGAVTLLSEWAFDNLPVDRIEITVEPSNAASRAVAERAGYTFEGVLRSHTLIKGRRRDMAMYSLLRGEVRRKHFHGHRAVEHHVAREINDAHAASAELAFHNELSVKRSCQAREF